MNNKKLNISKLLLIIFVSIIVMIIIIRAVVAIFNLIKNPTNTYFIKEGVITKEETQNGYVVRDETIVQGENYKNGMEQVVDEGQKVAKGEAIFRYFSDSEDDLKSKIEKLNQEINEAINNSTENLFSVDTKSIDEKIEEELAKISDVNDIQKLQEYKKELNSYIEKKAEIVGDLSQSGSHLKELINEKKEYEDKLSNGSEYVYAPKSGLLSYKVDGLEEVLKPDDFSKYNKAFLDNLNLKTGQIVATSQEQGKIVDASNGYIIFTSSTDEANNAKIGDKVKIVLPSTNEVEAEVTYITKENDNTSTIVLSYCNGIDELLSFRKISFDIIWWSESGYKVPNSSIFTENDLNYIIKTRGGYLTKVLVKVKKKTDMYSIITTYNASELNEINVEKNTKTSINLYDEILEKPTQSEIDSINKDKT